MTLIASLWILLAFSYILGQVAERFGQPALLGQMLAGILVGPSLLGWLKPDPGLAALVDFSVLFVVITAGLELRMKHLTDTFRGKGAIALTLGFLIPAASAAAFTYGFGMAFVPATVVVLCVSVTALPVALRILGTFGLLNTRVARIAIAGSLLSDVIVLLLLGTIIAVSAPQNDNVSLFATGSVAFAKLLTLLAAVGVCHYVCARLTARRQASDAKSQPVCGHNTLALAISFMLGLGLVSELLGFHFVIGVFFASLLVTAELVGETQFRSMLHLFELMTVGIFGPLFLAYQGVQFEIGALKNAALVGGLVAIAIGSKMIGGYAAARLNRLPRYEAYGVGIIMNARGVMEMVVATIAYRAGLVDQELFSTLLIIGIATTVITPSLLKQWLKDENKLKAMLGDGSRTA